MNPILMAVVAGLAIVGAAVGVVSARVAGRGAAMSVLLGAAGALAAGFPVLRYALGHVMDGSGPPALVSGPLAVAVPLAAAIAGAWAATWIGRRMLG